MDYIFEKRLDFSSPVQIDLHYCGKALYTGGHSFGPYLRDHFLLVFVENGDAELYTSDSTYDVNDHDLIVFYPDSKIFYEVRKNSDWRIWWMGISGNDVYSFFETFGVSPRSPVLHVGNHREVLSCFNEMYETMNSNHLEQKTMGLSLMYKIFSVLAHNAPEIKSSAIRNAVYYMNYHYDTIKNVSEVASMFGMSRNSFLTLFKKETGKSPVNYLEDLRFARACELLENTDLSVKSIAFSIGFGDPLYFSRFFKKYSGMSPGNYRKRI